MKVKKLAALVVLLVLVGTLIVACGNNQEKSTSSSSSAASSSVASSTTATNTTATSNATEKAVRVATTDEDYQAFNGRSKTELYVSKNLQRRVSMGDKLYIASNDIVSEYGYYEEDKQSGHTIRDIYYSISGLPILENYGHLVGTYGDIPVIELNRQNDIITARNSSNGNLTAYKCKLVGCTIGWIDDENAIWNQNDLISVSNPSRLQLTDLNGQPRSNPMDWEFGEELIVNCDGQSHQTCANSYVYSLDEKKIEITGEDTKVNYGNHTDTLFGYNFAKLEPGLYYFQDLGIYKIV